MNVYDYAESLLFGKTLADKLKKACAAKLDFTQCEALDFSLPKMPGRGLKFKISQNTMKFPSADSFHLKEKKALALHFFANHELMAIEMMASALLLFSHDSPEMIQFKKGLLKTIQDEQEHLSLYLQRINELGHEFGDFPLNDFFWKQMRDLDTPNKFYATMALTFEQANLDFAVYYKNIFEKIGDSKTSEIMSIILKDEITHVALGVSWLNRFRKDKSIWDYYREQLPPLITPARGKGIIFDFNSRKKTGMSDEFIDNMANYKDNYKVTNRKEWISSKQTLITNNNCTKI